MACEEWNSTDGETGSVTLTFKLLVLTREDAGDRRRPRVPQKEPEPEENPREPGDAHSPCL